MTWPRSGSSLYDFVHGDKVFVIPGRGHPPLEHGQVYTVDSVAVHTETIQVQELPSTWFYKWRFVLMPSDADVPRGVRTMFIVYNDRGLPCVPCEGIEQQDREPPRTLRGVHVRDTK